MHDDELEKVAALLKDPATYELGMQLWHDLHFDMLISMAHQLLSPRFKRIISAEELASSSLGRFHKALAEKRYQACSGHELRNVVFGILKHRALEVHQRQNAQKRVGEVADLGTLDQLDDTSRKPHPNNYLRVRDANGKDPKPTPKVPPNVPMTFEELKEELTINMSPENALQLKETFEELDSPYTEITLLTLQGFDIKTIAQKLDRDPRQVSKLRQQALEIFEREVKEPGALKRLMAAVRNPI